jgi:hypothetical protein
MLAFAALVAIMPLAFNLVSAAPAAEIAPRTTGSVTYYNPGLGACGLTHGDGDLVAAVSHIIYDAEPLCGRRLRVNGQGGGSVEVTVVDRCAGCAAGDIDLSPTAFQAAIGELGIGRQDANWEWI